MLDLQEMIEKYQERFLKTFKEDYQRYLFKKIDFEDLKSITQRFQLLQKLVE